ncbi:MAG: hypothetical protein J2P28_15940 [Actinobacteria bacterium]|nr:hypothetical protein [Actinomycetota bacterium]MBO0836980.1 hypothetical protein [Actinomycetota bacterium]
MTTAASRVSGVLLIVLGAWGALVPFLGPSIGFAYTSTAGAPKAWQWSTDHLYLSVVPGAAALLGGLLIVMAPRAMSVLGGLLAALGGAWFVAGGPVLAVAGIGKGPGTPYVASGAMFSSATMKLLENMGFFTGTGVVIVFFAALAMGRAGLASAASGELASESTGAFQPSY